jgi:hypothetical protein
MKKAKEYLTAAGFDQTHWGKIIVAAENRGSFTDSNNDKAATWVTCACGRITQDIPRNRRSRPLDAELIRLGNKFSFEVESNEFLSAARILLRIEARAIVASKEYLGDKS